MDQTDQITRQTELVPDVRATEVLLCRNGFSRSLLKKSSLPIHGPSSVVYPDPPMHGVGIRALVSFLACPPVAIQP
jgi:hypothetical protein